MQRPRADQGEWRIGELARRVGVSEHVLRAWERRYGVVQPARTASGYRLYSSGDEQRIRAMARLVDEGRSPAEAAAVVTSARPSQWGGGTDLDPVASHLIGPSRRRLRSALRAMDEPRAQRVLDDLLAVVGVETAIRRVLLPVLRELGDGWQNAQGTIAQEHFATAVVRGRIAGLARELRESDGPRALLACPPEERHDLGLQMFGLLLARRGWSINFLGADTPIPAIAAAVDVQQFAVVVLSATNPTRVNAVTRDLKELATKVRVVLAGPGANPRAAKLAGADLLTGDLVDAAETLNASRPGQYR